jgi:hypothetical protein
MKPAATKDVAQRPVYVMGDALTKYRAEYPSSDFIAAPEAEWRIRAATVARLGLEAFKSGRSDEPVSMQPIYLRLAEAEEKRLAREKGKT